MQPMTEEELARLRIQGAPMPQQDVGFIPESWAPPVPAPNVVPPPKPTPAATPRDIFSEYDPAQFMLSAQQEKERADKQAQVAIFQSLSNQFANHANQWKPGSVDQGANARLFQSYQGMIDEPVQALERKKSAYQTSEGLEQRRLANETVRAKSDPTSNVSSGLRLQVAQKARTMATLFKSQPEIAAQFAQMADAYEKGAQSGLDAEKQLALIDKMAGPIIGVGRNEAIAGQKSAELAENKRQFDEKLAETKEARYNATALKRAELALEEAKLKMAGEKQTEIMVNKPQEKLAEQLENLKVARNAMSELLSLKPRVNTGVVADKAAKIGALFDLTDEDRNRLNALVARVFNKETKELAGAAVSESEWARISPQIPQTSDDDGVFVSKLQEALRQTELMISARTRQAQRRKDGTTLDQSETILGATKQPVPRNAGERAAHTPDLDAKAEKARRAIKMGTPAQQAGAKAWLEANGYAP